MEPILSVPRCYGSFMLAALDVSDGDVMLDPDATGRVLFDGWVEGSSRGEFHAIGCRGNPVVVHEQQDRVGVLLVELTKRPLPSDAMTGSCFGR